MKIQNTCKNIKPQQPGATVVFTAQKLEEEKDGEIWCQLSPSPPPSLLFLISLPP